MGPCLGALKDLKDPQTVSGTCVKQKPNFILKNASNFWGFLAEHLATQVTQCFGGLRQAHLEGKQQLGAKVNHF